MSLRAFFTRFLLRRTFRKRMAEHPTVDFARTIGSAAEAGSLMKKPAFPDIKVTPISLGGVGGESLMRPDGDSEKALLYLHGGAWVTGSPQSYRVLTSHLAHLTGVTVYSLDYRLAPEHPYPAGLDDCMAAYRALLAKGIFPENIVIAGDSAGGNLALALALRLKDEKIPQPAALAVFSPVTDLTASGESYRTNAKNDVVFSPDLMPRFAPIYAPNADLRDPYVSPLFGDPKGLPSTLFQVAGTELLLDDSVRMAEKMRIAGISVTLDVWPGLWHVWHLSGAVLPEAVQAIEKAAEYIRKHVF